MITFLGCGIINKIIAPFFCAEGERKISTSKADSVLTELEQQINDLKVDYESYFRGVLKIEPYTDRQAVERMIRVLLTRRFTNTAHKFKFKQLTARFNTYKQYWNRILRKIEDGTYARDQFMMAHRDKVSSLRTGGVSQVKPKKDVHTKAQEKLYNILLGAKKKCNEDTSKLNFGEFQKMIKTQSDHIKSKYSCQRVQFKVVIDQGKTKLKITPKQ